MVPNVEVRLTVHPTAEPASAATFGAGNVFDLTVPQPGTVTLAEGTDRPPITLRMPLAAVTTDRSALPLLPTTLIFMDAAYEADLANPPAEDANLLQIDKSPLPQGRGGLRGVLSVDRSRANRRGTIAFMLDLRFERAADPRALNAPGVDGDLYFADPKGPRPRPYRLELAVVPKAGGETMSSLARLLAGEGAGFARFDGSMSGPDKDAAVADFRERVPVLLCSESGGEGRNIQFCNTLINFDIPWNPMAIEQRVGRIDRIGQSREVFVFNLVTRGTVEEQVLRLLDEKVNMFELVVGEAGAILGELDEERNFADLVLDAWLETTAAARAEAFDALGRRLGEAHSQYSDAKALDDALFGEEFETA